MKSHPTAAERQGGFSLAEVVAATLLLSLAIGPALTALQGAMQSTRISVEATANDYRILEILEEVQAVRFNTVAAAAAGTGTPSSYSDAPGTPDRRLVFIAEYDIDNADGDDDPFTGTENSVLWIRVEIEGSVQGLEALKGSS